MRIIKQGSKEKLIKTIKFECKCGCIFECTSDEVRKEQGRFNDVKYSHRCPTCDKKVYGY